jgi:hypothetical protein
MVVFQQEVSGIALYIDIGHPDSYRPREFDGKTTVSGMWGIGRPALCCVGSLIIASMD